MGPFALGQIYDAQQPWDMVYWLWYPKLVAASTLLGVQKMPKNNLHNKGFCFIFLFLVSPPLLRLMPSIAPGTLVVTNNDEWEHL